ncbi:MAG: hypothetical protein ABIC91_05095 [Nanoarchaeota archaeon]|nr:hypothetical protein [Nanoarchaeota archaeon]MBU1031185.1 hypothetical protein [Nanoarchaeota archaeon]
MKEKEIKQKLEEGFIRANVIFEVIGTPKEYVENALKSYVEKLKNDEEIIFVHEKFEQAEKQDTHWSTFAEVEMLIKGLEKVTWICFNFMPASIEILEPETLMFKPSKLTNWINDLLAKLHEISIVAQQVGEQNKLMVKNMNALVRNSILTCMDFGLTKADEIAKKIGVKKEHIAPVFEAMQKEGKIKKEKNKYFRTK